MFLVQFLRAPLHHNNLPVALTTLGVRLWSAIAIPRQRSPRISMAAVSRLDNPSSVVQLCGHARGQRDSPINFERVLLRHGRRREVQRSRRSPGPHAWRHSIAPVATETPVAE